MDELHQDDLYGNAPSGGAIVPAFLVVGFVIMIFFIFYFCGG